MSNSAANGRNEERLRKGLHLLIITSLVFIVLSLFFYLFCLASGFSFCFFLAEISGVIVLLTLGGAFFFLVEIAKIKKHG
ncbi:MAG: hypothetical protein ACOCVY_01025 [Patescibacteria group bacterium]